jgi:anthraniloyl-CoA monooxygenase
VRAVWPEDKPLAIALNTTDCAPGGVTLEDAVAIANIVKTHRCDLVEILAGQTTLEANPAYQPGFLTNFSDWVRSKSHVITLVGGNLTSTDEVNTIVASGRADLCLMRLNG